MAHALRYIVDRKPASPAEAALNFYAEQLRPHKKSIYPRTALAELLTDLMHLCDARGYTWEEIVDEAEREFLAHVDPEA